jgi:hypothetical protein
MFTTRSTALVLSTLISLASASAFAADANPVSSASLCAAPNMESTSAIADFEGGIKATEIQFTADGEMEISARFSEMTSFRVSEKEALRAFNKCQKALAKFAATNSKATQKEASIKDNSTLAAN